MPWRLFGGADPSDSDDPYDILRGPAGRASRRFDKLMSSGRRPSMALLDRVAEEKEERAYRFFATIEADVVGRAFYSGPEVDSGPAATKLMRALFCPPRFPDSWTVDAAGFIYQFLLLVYLLMSLMIEHTTTEETWQGL